ncbi:MAG: flagellar hook-basal body protein [Clostridiaceae bacterium]
MFNGLKIGSSGMKTAQNVMDNVADQIANASTSGYKKKQVDFTSLLMNKIGDTQVKLSVNAKDAGINIGSKAILSKTDFRQGGLATSEGDFHMALEGKGFFGVATKEGELLLTRNGGFHMNADFSITDDGGNLLSMETYLPQNQWPDGSKLNINEEGYITTVDDDNQIVGLGRVIVYSPENNDELVSLGEGKYAQPNGLALYNSIDNPGKINGLIRHNYIENSNVDTLQSMTDMLTTQRAYQASARSVTTADTMLDVINQIV